MTSIPGSSNKSAKSRPTPATLSRKLDEYLAGCRDSGNPVLVSSFAIFIGVDQETLRGWAEDARYQVAFRRLEDAAEDCAARALLSGRNATGIIFYLKSKHGWTDARAAAAPGRPLPEMTDEEWDALERGALEARRARLGEGAPDAPGEAGTEAGDDSGD